MKKITTEKLPQTAPPESLGAAPSLQWIPIEQLTIDPSYQRETTEKGRRNIRFIAENFNWAYFTPLMVSPIEGGRYAVIDGQHRTTAALLIGIEQVPCAVVIADRKTQAAAFHAVNAKRTKLHTVQIFHARLAAGDGPARLAMSVCEEAGVEIPRTPRNMAYTPKMTMSVSAIEVAAVKNRNAAVLTLQLLRETNERYAHLQNYMRLVSIQALFEVLNDHPDWCASPAKLSERFHLLDLEDAWAAAVIANARIKGTTVCDQLQALLVDHLEPLSAKMLAEARP